MFKPFYKGKKKGDFVQYILSNFVFSYAFSKDRLIPKKKLLSLN